MSAAKAFERHETAPRSYHIQTRLSANQEKHFVAMMKQTGCSRAETARQLIAKSLEELQGVSL